MLQEILNLPVIIQGALGSFLFWLAYEIIKWIVNLSLTAAGKVSKHLKMELTAYDAIHHEQVFLEKNSVAGVHAHVLAIFAALNRLTQAFIFICLGLIFGDVIGVISKAAYVIAIIYLFIALRAVQLEWGVPDLDEHRRKHELLVNKLNDIK